MTSRHLPFPVLAVALALLLPLPAHARSWQGITPGVSTQADVVARFGEPSTKGKLEGRTALVYKADQAIAGTRQAQFLVGEDGVVAEVNVFPATQLDRDSVEGTYGKGPQKTFTDDFRSVWIYGQVGILVFFGKDGYVEAIRFKAPERAGPRAAPPAAGQGAPPPSPPQKPPPAAAPAVPRN
jgi:hypothetical protein